LNGVVKLDSFGKATVIVDVKADATTEGAETLNLVLSNGAKVTADVAVNDVSLTPAPVAKTFTLTTGVDAVADFTGGAADDTFTARATNATTGVAATTVNDGDTLDGGAGSDTLNITATADNNRSLTGLATSNIETINIAGANNLGTLTTATAAPTAGAAQVQVLDITGARAMGEVQSVDFSGVTVATAGNVSVGGTTVALAAGDGPAAIATKVKAALDALTTEIVSVTQAGSKLTVQFLAANATGTDLNPADARLTVTTNAASSPVTLSAGTLPAGVVVKSFENSDSIVVTVNGVDYAAAVTVPAGVAGTAVAAPAAPTVVTTQGVTAVTETNVVTFGALTAGQSVTVNGITLTAGSAGVSAGDAAIFFGSAGTVPTGASATGTQGAGFTVGAAATNSVTYTSATAGAPVTNVAISVGAVGGATAPTAPTVVETSGVAVVTEASTVTFGALAIGQSVSVGGRTLTATAALTAEQVASAFATTAPTITGGTITGDLTTAGFTGVVTTNTAVMTSTTSGAKADIVIASAGNQVTTDRATALTNTVNAVTVVLNKVLAGAVTVGAGDEAGEIKLTSNAVGTALPTITVSQGTTSRSSVDAADGATVAAAVRTQAAASKEVQSITLADGAAGDAGIGVSASFELFVNGVSFGINTLGATTSDTAAEVAGLIASAINSALGAPTTAPVAVAVGATVTVTAPVAGTALPVIGVNYVGTTGDAAEVLTFAQVATNTQAVAQVVSAGSASVNAAQFVGSELVNLSGTSGAATVTGVTAGQTIGFTGVAMANTVAFGALTSGSIAVNASAGTLSTTGNALTTLALSGTGTSGLAITDGGTVAATGLDPIAALNLSTSGSTVLNTAAMGSLATLTQTGAGGVTLTPGTTLAAITTGAGADTLRVSTATAIDNPGTTINEAVNAAVTSGAGNDRLIITTTGAGTTTVDAGAGDDTLFVTGLSTGQNSLSGGDGNDAFRISSGSGLIAGLQNVTINGGAGTDTLRVSNTAFTASDYTILTANVSSVETLELAGVVTALDASKVSATGLRFLASGSAVTEVGSGQAVTLARTAAATATTGFSETGATVANPSAITVSSKGFILDNDATVAGRQSVFGDNLGVTLTNTAAATSVVANGGVLTLGVAALGTSATVTGNSTVATVTGELTGINVALQSARGSTTAAATENMAGFVASVVTDNLDNVSSITVTGTGTASINAGTIAAVDAKLTTISVSGMTAFADQDILGQQTGGVFTNLSTTTITLNNNVAETVLLGGAKDTVVTGSVYAKADTVTGFQLTASAADPLVVDLTRSDTLKIGVGFTATNAAKMTTTATTIEAALLQAAGLKTAAGADVENVVFHFGGNTYAYVDTGANGLTDNDQLVQLSGTLNLDLLLQTGVIIV
jgi:hypothetical protein